MTPTFETVFENVARWYIQEGRKIKAEKEETL